MIKKIIEKIKYLRIRKAYVLYMYYRDLIRIYFEDFLRFRYVRGISRDAILYGALRDATTQHVNIEADKTMREYYN